MPEQPDQEVLDVLRRLLASPAPGQQESAIMEALEYADEAASAAWKAAEGKTPAERFAVALQAAVETLEGIGLALAEGDKAEG